ncbi:MULTISPECIES: YcnI family protein [Streptomyces]|uniref:YcnI family copper-binding membrane protein n=1 Tax=Streptomyces TaxID=1883 RepID=UPI0004CB4EED|nr:MULTISPECIES: YcnI family protein [Streptomyces]MDX2917784.1 YcnI family protein [Streptomyces sp. NE06-03C]MDX3606888.1 YcnI family protein [Streptomyces sp. FL06-04B]MDX3735119.1 YcnI family protein [Streptomyces sp. ID01-15D]
MKLSRIALAGGVAASTVLLIAGPAAAHVSVQPVGEAAKGGYATLNFKVPNERDQASTVKLEVNFPADHPLSSVTPQAVPGWKIKIDKSKLDKPLEVHGKKITEAVSKVTWTADDSEIAPGYFQQFPVSVGALPEDADQLVFKAIQTYDNKEVVRWIEEPTEGGEEPESPAPVLKLSAAADDHHGSGAAATKEGDDHKAADTAAATEETHAAASSSSSDTTARTLGIIGIVIGVAGVAFGVLAGRRRSA